MSEVTKKVEVARVVKPKFLSLVGMPANQVAFKVIRDDNGVQTMAAPHIQRKRTARRSERLVSIEFDPGTSEDDVKKTLDDWGITDYTIETTDTMVVVRCSEAGDAPTMRVNLGEGRHATILKPISTSDDTQGEPFVSVVRMEFALDYFPDAADVEAWCKANSVDFSADAIQNENQQIAVRRKEVGSGDETRKIEVDSGVQFVVARDDMQDVPEAFIAVVNDAAYGSWGWGQLDFAATLADKEFSRLSEEAVYTLNRVVERILFYSDLPINIRKDLITRAAAQFSEYIVALMDALPARVVIATRSSKEKSMSKQTEQRSDAAKTTGQPAPAATKTPEPKAADAAPAPAAEAPAGDAPVTRADVEKMIGDAVKEATGGLTEQLAQISAKLDAPAQRKDGEGGGTPGGDAAPGAGGEAAAAAAASGEGEPTLKDVLRSVNALTDSVKAVNDRVQNMESSTVVRSDAGDAKQTTERRDPFKGMFGKQKQQS